MTDHSNFSEFNPQKEKTRVLALALVRCSSLLWDAQQKKLRCDWAEPAGTTAETATFLHKRGVLSPTARFLAIDNNDQVMLEVLKALKPLGDCAIPLDKDLIHLFKDLLSHRPPDYVKRIGVVIADLPYQISGDHFWSMAVVAINAAIKQCEEIGEFLLVLNPTDQNYRKGEAKAFWNRLNNLLAHKGIVGSVNPLKYPCKGTGGFMYFTPICFGFEADEGGIEWLR